MYNKRALISVSNKKGLPEFAKALNELGYEIIATQTTRQAIKDSPISANVDTRGVHEFTGFPYVLDGLVKTLNPIIHAGILMNETNPRHEAHINSLNEGKKHKIVPIHLVCANLYPFESIIARTHTIDEAFENYDIGGQTMLTAASKNFKNRIVVSDPSQYGNVIKYIKSGQKSEQFQLKLSRDAIDTVALYNSAVSRYMDSYMQHQEDLQDNTNSKPSKIKISKRGLNGIDPNQIN